MATSRREMLGQAAGALAGLAFIGCGLLRPAAAQTPQRRREVVVNGKRVRTVDVHAHCQFPEALALMGLKVPFPGLVVAPERIRAMDEQGIDVEALSINPVFWDKARATSPTRSCGCRTKSSPRPAPRIRIGLSASPRSPCNTPISPPRNWRTESSGSACAAR